MMFEKTKKISMAFLKYIGVLIVYILPVLLLVIGFDYILDFEVNFFQKESWFRPVVYIWALIINIAYIWADYGDFIKKYLP